jgi:hypothetical protein
MVKIEIYKGSLSDEISNLADSYEYKPYFYVQAAPEDGLNSIFRTRIERFLSFSSQQPDKAAMFLARDESDQLKGFISVQVLDFDTAVLKIPSGRINFCVMESPQVDKYNSIRPIADALVKSAADWLKERSVVFTNIRTAPLELPLIHALENSGFYFVDNGITAFWHKDNFTKYEKGGYDIRLFADKDLPTVLEIMRGAYTQDRFHLDPHIPYEAAEEMYQIWIHSSCTQPKENEWVLIAERNGAIKGFFEYEFNREFSDGTGIKLFSYGPAAVIRDRTALGAYYTLLSFAVSDSIMRGGDYAMTRIPFGIQPILKLTLRLGPSFMTNDLTFHHWAK